MKYVLYFIFALATSSDFSGLQEKRIDYLSEFFFGNTIHREDLYQDILKTFPRKSQNEVVILNLLYFTRFVLFPNDLTEGNEDEFKKIFWDLVKFIEKHELYFQKMSPYEARLLFLLFIHPTISLDVKEELFQKYLELPAIIKAWSSVLLNDLSDEEALQLELKKLSDFQKIIEDHDERGIDFSDWREVTHHQKSVYQVRGSDGVNRIYVKSVLKHRMWSIPELMGNKVRGYASDLGKQSKTSDITFEVWVHRRLDLLERQGAIPRIVNRDPMIQRMYSYAQSYMDDIRVYSIGVNTFNEMANIPWNQLDSYTRFKEDLMDAITEAFYFEEKVFALWDPLLDQEDMDELVIEYDLDKKERLIKRLHEYMEIAKVNEKFARTRLVRGKSSEEESSFEDIIKLDSLNETYRDILQKRRRHPPILDISSLKNVMEIRNKMWMPEELPMRVIQKLTYDRNPAEIKSYHYKRGSPTERMRFATIAYGGLYLKDTVEDWNRVFWYQSYTEQLQLDFILIEKGDEYYIAITFPEFFPFAQDQRGDISQTSVNITKIKKKINKIKKFLDSDEFGPNFKRIMDSLDLTQVLILIPDTIGFTLEEVLEYEKGLKSTRESLLQRRGFDIPDIDIVFFPIQDYASEEKVTHMTIPLDNLFSLRVAA